MGLKGYRTYRDNYIDDGIEVSKVMGKTFSPDFYNRHTIQVWDASNYSDIEVKKWVGATLDNRSLHEIYIVNNSGSPVNIKFSGDYVLQDEESIDSNGLYTLTIGPAGTAYFYATAVLYNNNLIFDMRTGSQDDKKI